MNNSYDRLLLFNSNHDKVMPLFTTSAIGGSGKTEKTNCSLAKTIVRAMKLTAIILLTFSLHVSAKLQSQVTLSEKNTPLEKVLASINKQTGFHFIYGEGILEEAGNITVYVKNVSLEDAIKACLKDKHLTYEMQDKVVVIKKKLIINPPAEKADAMIDITGKVQLDNGEAVVGATVLVKGTDRITTTNASGDFELKQVFDNAILIISGVSIETVEIPVNGRANIAVATKAKFNELDAMVVKGYYNTTRRLNTGNVSTVKGEDIQRQPVSDPIMALEGRVPGLNIQQQSGVPGAELIVQLRGRNSIANGNNPLYIVDGIPFTSKTLTNSTTYPAGIPASPFNSINPADIISIEILKDADATAIYGSRGANGVILITTRKGESGETKFDLNAYSGIGKITRKLDLLSTSEYLQMRHEAFANDGASPQPWDHDINGDWDTSRYTDWQKVLIGGTAKFTNVQAAISGGNSNTQFLLSGGFLKQSTVFPGSFSDQKASARISVTHTSTNRKFFSNFSASYIKDLNNLPQTDFTNFIALSPNAPEIYDSTGKLNYANSTFFTNPFANIEIKFKAITSNLISNLSIGYNIIDGLQFRVGLGYNSILVNEVITTPITAFPPAYWNYTQLREARFASNTDNSWSIEPQINYERPIGNGKLELLIGSTFQESIRDGLVQNASNFPSDALLQNISAASTIRILNDSYAQYRYNAVFGRIGYNLKNKYLINATARRDGSSRFGPGKQFGNFGAVGVGWIFSRETLFQQALKFLSYGKVRFSYGITGNDQLPDYEFLSGYSTNNSSYLGVTGLRLTRLTNPFYGWEEVKKFESGLEIGLFNDRLLLTASYYRNRTGNQLVGFALPVITGVSSIRSNLPAIIQNNGIELELNTVNITKRTFTWSTSFNISIPKSKLVSYPDFDNSNYANTYVLGQSLDARKLYHYIGVDQVSGVMQFESVDGASYSPTYPDDLRPSRKIGTEFFGGFSNSVTLSRFQIDAFLQFVKQTGVWGFSALPGTAYNQPSYIMDRWNKPGQITDVQKFTQDYGSQAATAFYNGLGVGGLGDNTITNASYIRLKNIAVSYDISKKVFRGVRFESLKVFLQCQNLFTITKFKGADPETMSWNQLPPLRIATVGLKLTL